MVVTCIVGIAYDVASQTNRRHFLSQLLGIPSLNSWECLQKACMLFVHKIEGIQIQLHPRLNVLHVISSTYSVKFSVSLLRLSYDVPLSFLV